MSEYLPAGLGWSELSWYEKITGGLRCEVGGLEGKAKEVCFEKTPEDEGVAQASGCTRLPYSSYTPGVQTPCSDDRLMWCCPEGYPREYMQDIPPETSVYEDERRRLLQQTPEPPSYTTPGPGAPSGPPAPVFRHTFWTRLTHPGALVAIGTLAGGGALFYLMRRRRQSWSFELMPNF